MSGNGWAGPDDNLRKVLGAALEGLVDFALIASN